MKLGIIAYSTETGLGRQTYNLYKWLKPDKILLVDLFKFNKMPTNHSIYEGNVRITDGIPTNEDIEWLTNFVDNVFYCETPLNYYLHEVAKKKNVRIFQQYNYEFLDYFRKPFLHKPTKLIAPSMWNIDFVQNKQFAPVQHLEVPIDRQDLPFRPITELKTIIHIIGRPGVHDRNGTLEFIEATKILGDDYKYIVYYQEPEDQRAIEYFKPVKEKLSQCSNIELKSNIEDYRDLYKEGDLLVLPRKYGGLCLPMQEALSSGIPVIMPNISPNKFMLPHEWLCEAEYEGEFFAHTTIQKYKANVPSLVNTILQFSDKEFIIKANIEANNIAEKLSWQYRINDYLDLFYE